MFIPCLEFGQLGPIVEQIWPQEVAVWSRAGAHCADLESETSFLKTFKLELHEK